MFSNVCEAYNILIKRRNWTLTDFRQPAIPTLIEDCLQHGIGPNCPGFSGWA
jgi:hypothetical protein